MAGIKPKPNECWYDYCTRNFGIGDVPDVEFDFVFGPDHANSIPAGLKRISWYLEGRKIPEGSHSETPRGYKCNWKLIEQLAA